jgi:mRNA interferase RelE/StbE
MIYDLAFKSQAKKEWDRLAPTIKEQLKKKLSERLINPHVKSAQLYGLPDCYKIKLKAAGYRLVYQVSDQTILITVVAIGKRERNSVYKAAIKRIE